MVRVPSLPRALPSLLCVFVVLLILAWPATAHAQTGAAQLCVPYFPLHQNGLTATLYIANSGDTNASFTATMVKAAGNQIPSNSESLLPGALLVINAADTGAADGAYSVRIVATSGLLVAAVHVRNDATGATAIYAVGACDTTPDTRLELKNLSSGASQLTLTNAGDTAVDAVISVPAVVPLDVTLPARSLRQFTASELHVPTGTSAIVSVTSSAFGGAPLHAVALWQGSSGVLDAEAPLYRATSLPNAAAAPPWVLGFVPIVHKGNPAGTNTGISVYNPQSSTAAITLLARNGDGTQSGSLLSDTVAAGAIKTFFPLGNVADGFKGSFVVLSDIAIVATSQTVGSSNYDSYISGNATPLLLPGVKDDSAVSTLVGVQNEAEDQAHVTVRFIPASGTALPDMQVTLNPGASGFFDTRTIAALPDPFVGSVSVSADQPVWAQVELSSTLAAPVQGVTSVTLDGPAVVEVNKTAVFTATVVPAQATTPITYTWTATAHPDGVYATNARTDLRSFSWTTTGAKSVGVQAANRGTGANAPTRQINVADKVQTLSQQPATIALQSVGLIVHAHPVDFTQIAVTALLAAGATAAQADQAGWAFRLDVYVNNVLVPDFIFTTPARLTYHYTDGEILGMDESKLRVLMTGPSAPVDALTSCTPPGAYVRNLAANTLELTICTPGTFWLDTERFRAFMPTVIAQ